MKTFRLVSSLLFVLVLSSVASAQSFRAMPGASTSQFVEQADPGALCPTCQVLLLKDAYAPPEHINPYSTDATPAKMKPTADTAIYDGANGMLLLVKSTPYGYVPGGYSVIGVHENAEWIQLRANMFWAVGDIDGDGRDDLIGHDKRTGEVVRVYRRGPR